MINTQLDHPSNSSWSLRLGFSSSRLWFVASAADHHEPGREPAALWSLRNDRDPRDPIWTRGATRHSPSDSERDQSLGRDGSPRNPSHNGNEDSPTGTWYNSTRDGDSTAGTHSRQSLVNGQHILPTCMKPK
uniref:Uncharacterized protein n=1 Tax=Spongospora subterranea TaxID=70186 RepID=A0A0H5RCZ7_9EUKA|eukprot:CRZ11631.1 hypothetical protein [Spongospora subterranea]